MHEVAPENDNLKALEIARKQNGGWWFGRLNYDLKNEVEDLTSSNSARFNWSHTRFFEAEWVMYAVKGQLTFLVHPNSSFTIAELESQMANSQQSFESDIVQLQPQMRKDEYLKRADNLMAHIQRGDIYEVNFCQEFYASDVTINPSSTYSRLQEVATPPMSALLRMENEWVLSMSPERYLLKKGQRLISQPIKGTARRSDDASEDEQIAKALQNDPKERAENVMIVDLVRNDLSRVAKRASVEVTELFGIHSFRTVHQMISTVEADMKPSSTIWDVIRASFPMGSMTGAPKVSAMKLIEEQEMHKREVYSGAVGYISPEDDFDFNVVIRTVLYDDVKKQLSVSVGSALTISANPEKEWEECLLKLKAIKEVLASPLVKAD